MKNVTIFMLPSATSTNGHVPDNGQMPQTGGYVPDGRKTGGYVPKGFCANRHEVVDKFPRTMTIKLVSSGHVETVALLQRQDS